MRARTVRRTSRIPSLYFNRELSWLEFNDRVLQLAEDATVPLLERAKFLAIWESNMDEFFMVRVATLHDQVESGTSARDAAGFTPAQALKEIRNRCIGQRGRAGDCFEQELRPALAEHEIRLVSIGDASSEEQAELDRLFSNQVFPVLTPLVIGRGRPFPYISNLSLSLAVVLRDPDKDNEILARVKVPKELLGRFLRVGDGGNSLFRLDALIAANLGSLFPGMEVVEHALFRVTRDTDYDVSDETDDVMRAVEEELRRRRFGEVVRLEVEVGMNEGLQDQLVAALGISEEELYVVEGMLDLSDLNDVVALSGHDELRDPPHAPVTPPRLILGSEGKDGDMFAAIRAGDILVHHPYDSFTSSVERFVKQAVTDPDVLAMKQTVYRTSADSPLVPALIEAAERGKQAVCLVELKARFDEDANITWAKKLEQAGVHVVYGIPALKTHVKCVLVIRREGDGVRHYVHIGTGNYNPKTARIYTDLGLFTCNPEIGADISEMFNSLTGYARPHSYRKVLVAPFNLHKGIIEEIERTIESHSAATPARIRMKMNSLLDASAIRALYRASQAGVCVEINVRGICALRPGVRRCLGEHHGDLDRQPLPRALADLLLRASLRAREHLHRLGRSDAAKPLQPRRARDPDPRRQGARRARRRPRPLPRRQHELVGAGRGRHLEAKAARRRRAAQRAAGVDRATRRARCLRRGGGDSDRVVVGMRLERTATLQ